MLDEPLPAWWPHRGRSQFVDVQGLRWHLQRWPGPAEGAPVVLLLHGTGAASHSWRHLAPLLAARHEVLAPDLPGHGFTRTPGRQALTLPAVAGAVAALLDALQRRPVLVVAHSAGAAVALQLVLHEGLQPERVVGVNAAVLPLQGPVGRLFLPAARLLSANPLVAPGFAAWAALPGATRRLLKGTGSRIDPLGERCYHHLVADARHARGALRLMASWDLAALERDLHALRVPLVLLAGAADRMLPPSHAWRVQQRLRGVTVHELPGLGHLAHEEDPALVAAACLGGLPAPGSAAACLGGMPAPDSAAACLGGMPAPDSAAACLGGMAPASPPVAEPSAAERRAAGGAGCRSRA
jgi:magnesium chelatase accessory protein